MTDNFQEQDWVKVLQAMEESYAQSLHYQAEIEAKNEALNQANNFISGVLSAMSDLLVVIDSQQKITQVNLAFLKLSGFEESAVLEQPIERFIHLNEGSCSAFSQNDLQDIQATLTTQHGKVPISLNCSCLNPEQCDFKGKVIIARPIDELLTAYETLKKANQELANTRAQMIQSEKMAALGRLVSGVAHELNTPISVLKGNLWTLQDYFSEMGEQIPNVNAEIEEVLEDIPYLFKDADQALRHIGDIVQSLKAFSQPQTQMQQQLFNLTEVIDTALNWVLANHAITPKIRRHLPEHLSMLGTPQALQQVLINLIQNALDAMKHLPSPQLTLTVEEDPQQVYLLIEDNGSGIAEKDISHIFDPFFTDKPIGQGTGLGLSISQQIIESMQGQLTAWNRPEGGAAFQITLPCQLFPSESSAAERIEERSS